METARRPYKGYGPIDFFGLFDIIAHRVRPWTETEMGIRPGIEFLHPEGCPELLFVQVKTAYCPPAVKAQIEAFKVPADVRKQVVIYRDYVRRPEVLEIP